MNTNKVLLDAIKHRFLIDHNICIDEIVAYMNEGKSPISVQRQRVRDTLSCLSRLQWVGPLNAANLLACIDGCTEIKEFDMVAAEILRRINTLH